MKTLAHRNIPLTIIGGGIHGISIALRILREMPAAARHLAIVDRHRHPLTEWQHKTERQGMTFLRSPAVHHITPDALGIVEYAERHERTDELRAPYSQPSTKLFWDFCNQAISEFSAHNIYYQFDVAKLRWDKGAGKFPFRLISTKNEGFRSRYVILAIGIEECFYVPPEFAVWQRRWNHHILHASHDKVAQAKGKVAIVGGGLTAGTLARTLSERGVNVALIMRSRLRVEQFDFPPVWVGPNALADFSTETDFQRRYDIIQQVRGHGSITPNIAEALQRASNVDIYPAAKIQNIKLCEHTRKHGTQPDNLGIAPTNALQIETTRGTIYNISRIILATGYQFNLCRYPFLAELIRQHKVPLLCGLPQLEQSLQLYPVENLFGSGAIAQLQLGPAAGNIIGVNLAYERLREKLLPKFSKLQGRFI